MNTELTLNSTLIEELFNKLASDDQLRKEFEKDPEQFLLDTYSIKLQIKDGQPKLPSKNCILALLNRFDKSSLYQLEDSSSSLVSFVFRFFQRNEDTFIA